MCDVLIIYINVRMVVEIHMFITVCFLQQRYYRLLCPVAYMCVYVLVTLGWVDGTYGWLVEIQPSKSTPWY